MRTLRVTSRGTRVMRIPDERTRSAASGSTWMLNSAPGVAFPGSAIAPPMMISRRIRRSAAASSSSARAMLVSGPSAAMVSASACSRALATIAVAALPPAGFGPSLAGNSGRPRRSSRPESPARPSPPWTFGAVFSLPRRGRAAPRTSRGGASGSSRASRRRALSVAARTSVLPATVVMSSTRSSGERSARTIASASSMPGSVSMTSGRGADCRITSGPPLPDERTRGRAAESFVRALERLRRASVLLAVERRPVTKFAPIAGVVSPCTGGYVATLSPRGGNSNDGPCRPNTQAAGGRTRLPIAVVRAQWQGG